VEGKGKIREKYRGDDTQRVRVTSRLRKLIPLFPFGCLDLRGLYLPFLWEDKLGRRVVTV